jgi:hypothetical protein
MLSMKKIAICFLLLFVLTGCSWRNYFTITNSSNSNITITYIIKTIEKGFPIFETIPRGYKSNAWGEINWDKKMHLPDFDSSFNVVNVILPPHTTLIMGELSNDNYVKHDQYFINGRVFNLEYLEIRATDQRIEITPSQFDRYFKKRNQMINYEMK